VSVFNLTNLWYEVYKRLHYTKHDKLLNLICLIDCRYRAWLQVTCPKGHLSEMLNVPVQIPKFDAKPKPNPNPNPNPNSNPNPSRSLERLLKTFLFSA